MNFARILMVGVAVLSGALAYGLLESEQPAPARAAAPATDDVLYAATDWPVAKSVTESDVVWRKAAMSDIQPGMIRRSLSPDAVEEIRGAHVRQPVAAGEPVRRDRLLKNARGSGFIAATLTPGMRAIAIQIDPQGAASAGGFVFPNDRVDVMSVARAEAGERAPVETILENVRVLAIGPNAAERPGERVLNGATATIEVTPSQAELALSMQRRGPLALALRPPADAIAGASASARTDPAVSVIRYGVQGMR